MSMVHKFRYTPQRMVKSKYIMIMKWMLYMQILKLIWIL